MPFIEAGFLFAGNAGQRPPLARGDAAQASTAWVGHAAAGRAERKRQQLGDPVQRHRGPSSSPPRDRPPRRAAGARKQLEQLLGASAHLWSLSHTGDGVGSSPLLI